MSVAETVTGLVPDPGWTLQGTSFGTPPRTPTPHAKWQSVTLKPLGLTVPARTALVGVIDSIGLRSTEGGFKPTTTSPVRYTPTHILFDTHAELDDPFSPVKPPVQLGASLGSVEAMMLPKVSSARQIEDEGHVRDEIPPSPSFRDSCQVDGPPVGLRATLRP